MRQTRTIKLPTDDIVKRLMRPLQAKATGTVPVKRFRTFTFGDMSIDVIRINDIRVGEKDLRKRVATVMNCGIIEYVRETTFHDRNGKPIHEYR